MRLFLPVFAVFALACSGGASPESEVPATVASWRTDEMLVAAVASLPEADRAPVSAWLDAQAALERAGKPTKVVPGMKVGDLPPLAAKAATEAQDAAVQQELCGNADGIKVAQLSYDAAFDTFVAAAPAPRAVDALDTKAVPWSANEGFTTMGWRPDADVRGTYWVEITDNDFTVHAVAKLSTGALVKCVSTLRENGHPTPI
jgi:hypothetical protein